MNCYTPNSQRELKRLDYRMRWEDDFQDYLARLDAQKPAVLCGDLNVAHREIDLKNPATNHMNAGFTDQEREKFSALLARGFTDSFRHFYPDLTGAYSWWSYMFSARQEQRGVAHRLFCGFQPLDAPRAGSGHPLGYFGF